MNIADQFAAAGVSLPLYIKAGESFDYAMTSTAFDGTISLERSHDGGLSWEQIVTGILDTVASTRVKNYGPKNSLYRLHCYNLAAPITGTMDYTLANVGDDQTLYTDGAVSNSSPVTKLELTALGSITLDVPDDSMYGQIKTIEMTVDNGDVDLDLTNVVGGSASTSATFTAVGQMLVLIAATSKWIVIKEYGVTVA